VSWASWASAVWKFWRELKKQEAQLMLTNPHDALDVSQGLQTLYHSTDWVYGFLLVFYSNFVPKT